MLNATKIQDLLNKRETEEEEVVGETGHCSSSMAPGWLRAHQMRCTVAARPTCGASGPICGCGECGC